MGSDITSLRRLSITYWWRDIGDCVEGCQLHGDSSHRDWLQHWALWHCIYGKKYFIVIFSPHVLEYSFKLNKLYSSFFKSLEGLTKPKLCNGLCLQNRNLILTSRWGKYSHNLDQQSERSPSWKRYTQLNILPSTNIYWYLVQSDEPKLTPPQLNSLMI